MGSGVRAASGIPRDTAFFGSQGKRCCLLAVEHKDAETSRPRGAKGETKEPRRQTSNILLVFGNPNSNNQRNLGSFLSKGQRVSMKR